MTTDKTTEHDEDLDDQGEQGDEGLNYLDMSDEDMLKLNAPTDVVPDKAPVKDEGAAEDDKPADTENTDDAGGEKKPAEGDDEPAGAGTATKPGEEKPAGEKAPKEGEKPVVKDGAKADDKAKPEGEKPAVNYEAEYKRILAPFKANGREIQVESVDDAITLMQMGANFNKKMAGLKPHLKIVKLLENNGLLDEGKLSFLIDLDKKSPAAINKLVKDAGLNPMDLDPEKAGEYKPTARSVDDREIALDDTLDSIKDSKSYQRTLGIVGQEWDESSKQAVAQAPQLLKVINDHVERGVYDLIAAEVERQRMFGRLDGMSSLEAYRQCGDAIQARGGFDHLGSSQGKTDPGTKVVVQPKPKQGGDDKRNDKRRAAGSTKPAAPDAGGPKADFNPLDLPDDEFEKLSKQRFR